MSRMESLPDDEEETEDEAAPEPNAKLWFAGDSASGFMFALVRFWDEKLVEKNGMFPLAAMLSTTFCLHIVSLAAQLYLAAIIYVFVIERNADQFEAKLQFREDLLQKAIATNTPLDESDPAAAQTLLICWNDHSVIWSQSVILFIWFARSLIDIRDAVWSTYVSWVIPNTHIGDVLQRSKGSDKFLVLRLTPCLRWSFLLLANIPRVIVTVIVAIVGAKFLEFAGSAGVLIMKSVGLAFISTLNQMLFTALAPARFVALQKQAAFHYHTDPERMNWMVVGSLMSLVKVVGLALLAVLVSRVLFNDVAVFRATCNDYESHFLQYPVYDILWKQSNLTTLGFNVFGHVWRA